MVTALDRVLTRLARLRLRILFPPLSAEEQAAQQRHIDKLVNFGAAYGRGLAPLAGALAGTGALDTDIAEAERRVAVYFVTRGGRPPTG